MTSGRAGRVRRAGGYTIAEILLVVVVLGILASVALPAWQTSRRRVAVSSAARLTKLYLYQARMYSIYRGINHFVVLDPVGGSLEIYADNGNQPGLFDTGDERIAAARLSPGVTLGLPSEPSPLSRPVGGGSVSDAWSIAGPDTSGAWGPTRKGVIVTPTGRIESAQSTPVAVDNGLIVFSDASDRVSAVAVRGRLGTVTSYVLSGGSWRDL